MLVIIKIITSIIYIIDIKIMVGEIYMETSKAELKTITNQLDSAWSKLSFIRGQYQVYERNNDIDNMDNLRDEIRWYDGVYYGLLLALAHYQMQSIYNYYLNIYNTNRPFTDEYSKGMKYAQTKYAK